MAKVVPPKDNSIIKFPMKALFLVCRCLAHIHSIYNKRMHTVYTAEYAFITKTTFALFITSFSLHLRNIAVHTECILLCFMKYVVNPSSNFYRVFFLA